MSDSFHVTTHIDIDNRTLVYGSNIDPDCNFFNNKINERNYHTNEQFKKKIKVEKGITMVHFNSGSLYANFQSIKEYITQFKQLFKIIAISETWMTPGKQEDFE